MMVNIYEKKELDDKQLYFKKNKKASINNIRWNFKLYGF